ncbi:MAG TPA: cytidylate kinase family protein [Candidatus Binatia bacterium]|jgi:cytidylate kinase
MSIITISHEAFGDGRAVAERVAAILRYRCISREVLVKASQRYGISEAKLFEVLEEKPHHWWVQWLESRGIYRIALQAAICELAQEGNIVYHGRAGQEFFPGIRHVLNVFLDTSTESRIKQVMARKGLAEEAARKYLEELDRIRARRTKDLFKIDWRDPTRYDIVLSTARTTIETAARMIAEVSQREEYRPTPESLQAVKDLTITARVEAVLLASSRLEISNLEVETRCGEVHVSGVILAESIKDSAADMIRNIPGVTRVTTQFVVTPSEHYLYGDGR